MLTPFAKYEGAGNDFLLLDLRDTAAEPDSRLIARLCDRRFGIGADGLMTLRRSAGADCAMRYYNADGSEGAMCGNGGRCFALFARHLGLGEGKSVRFEAPDAPHTARILEEGPCTGRIELGMKDVERIVREVDGRWSLDTGVPHCVLFVASVEEIDVAAKGGVIRRDTGRYPEGTNVDFVAVEGEGRLRVRTYERGVEAETLACGTGATAAALAANRALQPAVSRFEVHMPGGRLDVEFERRGEGCHRIRLTGAARRVFAGIFDTENF